MMLPPPSLDHLPRRRLSDVKHAGQVDRDDAVPGLGIDLEEIAPMTDPGRFEHDVEPAEFAHDSGNGRIDRDTVAHVESRRGRPPAGSTNSSSGSLGRGTIAVGAEHRRALACQRLGPGAADAASRSRNQRHFARDPPHAVLLSCRPAVFTTRPGSRRDGGGVPSLPGTGSARPP